MVSNAVLKSHFIPEMTIKRVVGSRGGLVSVITSSVWMDLKERCSSRFELYKWPFPTVSKYN